MKSLLLVLLVILGMTSCESRSSINTKAKADKPAYLNASRVDSDVIFTLDVRIDVVEMYNTGDTVWVENNSRTLRLCDECSFYLEPSGSYYFKAVIR